MDANTKTVFFRNYNYMQCDDFANYLNKMAAKGWHFKEWGVGLQFEKGEPKNTTYAVEVFTEATEEDVKPEKNTKEFAEYCEAAGWKLIDAKRKFCVFEKIREDAVDILTPEERVNNAYKGTMSPLFLITLVAYGMVAALRWATLAIGFSNDIFSSFDLFFLAIWSLFFLQRLYRMVNAIYKRRCFLRDVADGKELYIGTRDKGQIKFSIDTLSLFLLTSFVVWNLCSYGMLGAVSILLLALMLLLGFKITVNKIRPKRETHRAVSIIFAVLFIISVLGFSTTFLIAHEIKRTPRKLPLYVSDYRENEGNEEEAYGFLDTSIFGSKRSCKVPTGADSLYYQVYRTDYDWILDKIWEEQKSEGMNKSTTDVSGEWEALEAYRNNAGDYYVKYEDAILVFEENTDVILSLEQIHIIRDKLDLR